MKIKSEIERYIFKSGGLDQIYDTANYIKKFCDNINENAIRLLNSLRKVGPDFISEHYNQVELIIQEMIKKTDSAGEEMKELSESCKEFVSKIEEINRINFD